MSENEKMLRDWCGGSPAMAKMLDALLAEHRTDVSRARAEALEEAAQHHDRKGDEARTWLDEQERRAKPDVVASWRHALQTHRASAVDLRALITTPAPASISVEMVREVLIREFGMRDLPHHNSPMGRVFTALGVPLDAATEKPLPPTACGQKDSRGWLCRQWDEHEGPHVFEPHPDAIAPERNLCDWCGLAESEHSDGGGVIHAYGKLLRRVICSGFRHVEQEGPKGCPGCRHPPHARGKCHQQGEKGLCVCAVEEGPKP